MNDIDYYIDLSLEKNMPIDIKQLFKKRKLDYNEIEYDEDYILGQGWKNGD